MARDLRPSQYGLVNKGQRKEYLYTKGKEYSLDGVEYIGEYHLEGRTAKTGPIKDAASKVLRKYYPNQMLYDYDRCRNFPRRERVDPNQIVWAPIDSNFTTGFATRYFVERTGNYEGYPIEIDLEQADKYGKEGGIDEGVYVLVKIPWKLTGFERTVYKNNEVYVEGIFEHNQRQVILATRVIPNLREAIRNYTEYARITLNPEYLNPKPPQKLVSSITDASIG